METEKTYTIREAVSFWDITIAKENEGSAELIRDLLDEASSEKSLGGNN